MDDKIACTCKVGETGEIFPAKIFVRPRRSVFTLQVDRPTQKGDTITVAIEWPMALEFASAVCAKAAEIAAMNARSEQRTEEVDAAPQVVR
jgi:hypothetical protein